MKILRWVVTPLAAIAAWLLVLVAGTVFHNLTEIMWCGREPLRTYQCRPPGWLLSMNVGLFAGLAAAAVMIAAWLTAPVRSPKVTWWIFFVGLAIAAVPLFNGMIGSFLSAAVCGAATAHKLAQSQQRPPNQQ